MTIHLKNKRLRARVIKKYYGDQRLYAFSCGNATAALAKEGCNLVAIDGSSPIEARRYVTPKASDHYFNGTNVTSGYLPLHLMLELAREYQHNIGEVSEFDRIFVPCGSGETLLALSFFIPMRKLLPIVSGTFAPMKLDQNSPLENWVRTNFEVLQVDLDTLTEIKAHVLEHANQVRADEAPRKYAFVDTGGQGLIYNN